MLAGNALYMSGVFMPSYLDGVKESGDVLQQETSSFNIIFI
jgi:hypothetical protein